MFSSFPVSHLLICDAALSRSWRVYSALQKNPVITQTLKLSQASNRDLIPEQWCIDYTTDISDDELVDRVAERHIKKESNANLVRSHSESNCN